MYETEKQEALKIRRKFEKAMVDFIERETKEPTSKETLAILPQMAHTLVTFWTINRP